MFILLDFFVNSAIVDWNLKELTVICQLFVIKIDKEDFLFLDILSIHSILSIEELNNIV